MHLAAAWTPRRRGLRCAKRNSIPFTRVCAGENLERERFQEHASRSYRAGMGFARAKAWLEAANRASIHASLLILFGLGGWLVTHGRMPLRVMLTGIGFTYSLMYATQVRPPPLVCRARGGKEIHHVSL